MYDNKRRNPLHAKRPKFSKISSTLAVSSKEILELQSEARHRTGAGQIVLGGQLSEAKNLYLDLQNTYLQKQTI